MSQENVEIVRGFFDAWERHDAPAALARFDPDVAVDMTAVSFPGMQVEERGHDGLGRALGAFLSAWGDLEWFPDHFIDADEHVIVWIRARGRGRQSGVPVEARVAAVYTIRDGLVIRWRGFDTLAAAAEAVGI